MWLQWLINIAYCQLYLSIYFVSFSALIYKIEKLCVAESAQLKLKSFSLISINITNYNNLLNKSSMLRVRLIVFIRLMRNWWVWFFQLFHFSINNDVCFYYLQISKRFVVPDLNTDSENCSIFACKCLLIFTFRDGLCH